MFASLIDGPKDGKVYTVPSSEQENPPPRFIMFLRRESYAVYTIKRFIPFYEVIYQYRYTHTRHFLTRPWYEL